MKKKILSVKDPKFETCKGRVVIERDDLPPNPMKDYDQVFLVWSMVPDEIAGSPGAKDPFEEAVDEDGFPTGTRKLRDGLVAFPASALIHSGVWLKLGNERFAEDPAGWDTVKCALILYTDQERFDKMCGTWRTVADGNIQRDAKDDAEWNAYLRSIAEDELKLIQKYLAGDCFRYKTEEAVKFVKKYEDGREENGVEWTEGDSCGGYYVDEADDIDFPRVPEWEVFDKTGWFVGQEYNIPVPA